MPRPVRLLYDFLNIKDYIFKFEGDYHCFDESYPLNFSYFGSQWHSIKEAYDNLVESNFNDSRKIHLMGEIIYTCFSQNESQAKILKSTEEIWLEKKVTNHDNFWHNCSCKECFLEESTNYYGRLLMEVRDRLIWEGKREKVNKKRWHQRYF